MAAPSAVAAASGGLANAEPAAQIAGRKRKVLHWPHGAGAPHAESAKRARQSLSTALPFSFEALQAAPTAFIEVAPPHVSAEAIAAARSDRLLRSAQGGGLQPPCPSSAVAARLFNDELGGSQNAAELLRTAKDAAGGSQEFDQWATAVAQRPVLRARVSTRKTMQFLTHLTDAANRDAGASAVSTANAGLSSRRDRARALLEAVAGGAAVAEALDDDWVDGGADDGDLDGDDVFAVRDADDASADDVDADMDDSGSCDTEHGNDVNSINEGHAGGGEGAASRSQEVQAIPFGLLDLCAAPMVATAPEQPSAPTLPGFCLASLLSQVRRAAPVSAGSTGSTGAPVECLTVLDGASPAPASTVRVHAQRAEGALPGPSAQQGVRLQYIFK